METWSAVALAFALSVDGLAVGVAYGMRRIRVPLKSLLIIGMCSAACFFVAMSLGQLIAGFVGLRTPRVLGAAILVGLGLWNIGKAWLDRRDDEVAASGDDVRAVVADTVHGDAHDVTLNNAHGIGLGGGPDVRPDAGPGAGSGAGLDTGPEVDPGAGSGARPDTGPEVVPGAGSGASPDAGPGSRSACPGVALGVGRGDGAQEFQHNVTANSDGGARGDDIHVAIRDGAASSSSPAVESRAADLATLMRIRIRGLGIVVQVLREPGRADMDRSGAIDAGEALVLGVALGLDALAAGFGASLIGFHLSIVGVVAAAQLFLTWLGLRLGRNYGARWLGERGFYVPGVILILIGLLQL